jgi:hypothetical protein
VRDDVRDEVEFHVAMRTADLMAEGLTPSEARTRLRRVAGKVREDALLAARLT